MVALFSFLNSNTSSGDIGYPSLKGIVLQTQARFEFLAKMCMHIECVP